MNTPVFWGRLKFLPNIPIALDFGAAVNQWVTAFPRPPKNKGLKDEETPRKPRHCHDRFRLRFATKLNGVFERIQFCQLRLRSHWQI